jgi:L-fuculose-phosphate aldolase
VNGKAPCTDSSLCESGVREELVQACRVLYAVKAAGDGLGGHLSARLDERRILIKPRPVSWRGLQPQDLIVIDFNGKRVDGAASERSAVREWPIHAQIYAARPDVQCVLHAHPSASTLMAALGIAVEPLDQDCAAFAGRLAVLDNGAVSISTPELGDEVARALGTRGALLLKNHGSVTGGFSDKIAGDVTGEKRCHSSGQRSRRTWRTGKDEPRALANDEGLLSVSLERHSGLESAVRFCSKAIHLTARLK